MPKQMIPDKKDRERYRKSGEEYFTGVISPIERCMEWVATEKAEADITSVSSHISVHLKSSK